jgi:hypothetical protein
MHKMLISAAMGVAMMTVVQRLKLKLILALMPILKDFLTFKR